MARKQQFKPRLQLVRFIASGLVIVGAAIATATLNEVIATMPSGVYSKMALAETKSLGEKVYEKASPAVVSIRTREGWGSGIIIQRNGLVLTNAHVVRGERAVTVVLKDGKTELKADVVALGQDCVDLALVQIRNQNNLPALAFAAKNSVRPGQQVFAIGSPLEEDLNGSLTQGIVSKLHPERQLIQSSVDLNPGNSGGPLLNDEGALIGVNTFILKHSQGISFSIALEQIQSFLDNYKQGKVISSATKAVAKQEVVALALNGSNVRGKLTQEDAIACKSGSFYDTYQFEGKSGQSVLIRMESKAFAPYLVLLDPNGNAVAIDENTPNDDYAILVEKLPATGTYQILAESRTGKQVGTYTLRATPLMIWRQGEFAPGDPTLKDGSFYQVYDFQGQANQSVSIMTYSTDFAPYIAVINADGKVIAKSGAATRNQNSAVLQVKLPRSGSYKVVVNTAKPGEQGKYSLMVQ